MNKHQILKHLGLTCIRAGWYYVQVDYDFYVHVKRSCGSHPSWGWDIFTSDSQYTFLRQRLVVSSEPDLIEAAITIEERFNITLPLDKAE